jgi:hypothetical protein
VVARHFKGSDRGKAMARILKGAKRYLFLRGKDDHGGDIVLDLFSKKELDEALKERRVSEDDYVVKIEVLERMDLKKPKRARKK